MDASQRELFRFFSIVDNVMVTAAVVVVQYMVVVGFWKSLSATDTVDYVYIVTDWTSFCYFKNRFMLVILLTPLRTFGSGDFFSYFDTFDTRTT